MIYECFYFHDELDLLDLKLHELQDVVDKFVLIEYPRTVDGVPQQMFYNDNKERFREFSDKIIHIVGPEQEPSYEGYWCYIRRKRRDFAHALQNCSPNDIIIASDPDIIYHKDSITALSHLDMRRYNTRLVSDWYIYYMDYLYTKGKFDQNAAFYYKNLNEGVWETANTGGPIGYTIDHAGYHFSKLGGVDKILNNLTAGYPLRWLNNPKINNREVMQERIDKGYAWDSDFGGIHKATDVVMKRVLYDPSNYPKYVNEHPEIYCKYFKGDMDT